MPVPTPVDGESARVSGQAAQPGSFQAHAAKHAAAVVADNPTLALGLALASHFRDHEARRSAGADEAIPPGTDPQQEPTTGVETADLAHSPTPPVQERQNGTPEGVPSSGGGGVAAAEDEAVVDLVTAQEATAPPSVSDSSQSQAVTPALIELEEQAQDQSAEEPGASDGASAAESPAVVAHVGAIDDASSPGSREALNVAGAKGNAQNAAVEASARKRAEKKAQKKKQDEAEAADLAAQVRARLAEKNSPGGAGVCIAFSPLPPIEN